MPFGFLPLLAVLLCTAPEPPGFGSVADLERFLFELEENGLADPVRQAFLTEKSGVLIGLAAKLGPEYALRVAKEIPYPEFREPYHALARYLDLHGPWQKQDAKDQEGWWSGYGAPPDDSYCSEVAKLLSANLLWNQVHYCRQLLTGEAKPKTVVPEGNAPPWHLDQPPVRTVWLHTDVLYGVADAAIGFRFGAALRRRVGEEGNLLLRESELDGAAELEKQPPNRDLAAVALAKVLLRSFEAIHRRHFEALTAPRP
jgi:hypothetical protein